MTPLILVHLAAQGWGKREGLGCLSGAPSRAPPYCMPHAPLYLAELVKQLRDARQPLCGSLVIPILEHQLHHLGVPSADGLLKDWGVPGC